MRTPVETGVRRPAVFGSQVARTLAIAVVIVSFLTTSASADSVHIGGTPDHPDESLFIPFGALTFELRDAINDAVTAGDPVPIPRFQQVYDASAFPQAPLSIESFTFFESASQISNAELLGGTTCTDGRSECGLFSMQISTTQSLVNGLAEPTAVDDYASFDLNLDPLFSAVESFTAPVLLSDIESGATITFLGDTAFSYDPRFDGNLIIDLQIGEFSVVADITQGGSTLDFDWTDEAGFPVGGAPYSVVDNYDGVDNSSFGLVTEVGYSLVVPEPTTALMLGLGLFALVIRRPGSGRLR